MEDNFSTTIRERAILVSLTISAWSGRRYDKAVSQKVDKLYSTSDSGRFNKILIDMKYLKNIQMLLSRARSAHYAMTLPWSDQGMRMLPAKMYFDYTVRMKKILQDYNEAVDDFIQKYPTAQADARISLGTMYSDKDYPPVSSMKARFGHSIDFFPVPDKKDFRVDLDDNDMQDISDSLESSLQRSIEASTTEMWDRLHCLLASVVGRLDIKDSIFRDSLINNVKDLTDKIPNFNVLDDADLEAMRLKVIKFILPFTPDRIRKSEVDRNKLVSNARILLNSIYPHTSEALG